MTELRPFLERPFCRYVIVGGTTYLFELAIITIVQWRGGSALFAVALSFWVGLFISFCLQKLVTFGDKRLRHQVLLPQATIFLALVLFNFGFTLLATKVLAHLMPTIMIRTLALGMTTIWNYYLYRTRIFRNDDKTVLID